MAEKPAQKLKSKLAQAKKELETFERIIASKQIILSSLTRDIEKSEKTLAEEFDTKRLKQDRDHKQTQQTLQAEVLHVKNTISVLREQEWDKMSANKELEQQQDSLRAGVIEAERNLRSLKLETSDTKVELSELRNRETRLTNTIDDLKAQKKQAEDTLATQVMQHSNQLFEMQASLQRQQNDLEQQIDDTRQQLLEVQKEVHTHKELITRAEEDLQLKETELIQRENSLIVKTKALANKDATFETEVRRWNYLKSPK